MKRRLVQSMLAVLVLLLTPFLVSAQETVNDSGFQIQNLSESDEATVTIEYYAVGGSSPVGTQDVTIPAGGSRTILSDDMPVPDGFRGSVVISSSVPVAAIANLLGTPSSPGSIGASYGGFDSGSATASLPLVTRNNFGVSTAFSVQNTGDSAVTVNVDYFPGVVGESGATDTATIEPGASAIFNQGTKSELGTRFVGSAQVEAPGGSIAVTTLQEGNDQLLAYDAFTGGSPTVAVPLLVANNFGNFTGLQIQNSGDTTTDVTVTYAPNTLSGSGVCGTPPAETFSLDAGTSRTLIQAGGDADQGFNNFFATCRYVGGAIITNSENQPLVAIVNQVTAGANNASAYEGFPSAVATGTAEVPLVFANNFGLISGVQIQNAGNSAADVTITYGPNTVTDTPSGALPPCSTPQARTQNIAAGASFTFIQAAGSQAEGFDPQFEGCRYVGSATITASGGQVVAIVNQVNTAAATSQDTLFTYNAFNQ
jgi:hypothetical protein